VCVSDVAAGIDWAFIFLQIICSRRLLPNKNLFFSLFLLGRNKSSFLSYAIYTQQLFHHLHFLVVFVVRKWPPLVRSDRQLFPTRSDDLLSPR
jgi:hypothetical protein